MQWDQSVIGDFIGGGQFFNCSDIFNFVLANNSASNTSMSGFKNLKCTGAYAPDGNVAQVTIYNVSQANQALIRQNLVQLQLVKGSYHISCVQFGPLTLSITSDSSSSNGDVLGVSPTGRRL